MDTLPIILFIVAVVIPALFFLYRFLVQFTTKPVLEINLSPSDDPRWSDKKKIRELIETFQKNGFVLAGQYECWEIPGLIIAGFVNTSEQLVGVINDHPIAGIWEDVCVQYIDGENLTISNAPMGQEMDHMPQSTKIYMKGSSLDELIAKALSERKNKARKTITKEEFSSNFEEAYKKEMKWRMERSGPTALEVKRVADEMSVPLDSEKMQAKTKLLQKIWMKEKIKPRKMRTFEAELPGEFQRPEVFRQNLEQKSAPVPQIKFQPMPVYTVFILTLVCWCYYGYQYNEAHRPVSFTVLIIFLLVFLVLFVAMMSFREYNRRVRMCPVLKHLADMRPGAFLFIAGTSPILFYAKEGWLGKVILQEGGENQDAISRLEAITRRSGAWLSISKKGIISKIFGRSDKNNIPLPDSDFGKKFIMSGADKVLAEDLLKSGFTDTMLRLDGFKNPNVDIDGRSVIVEITGNLSSPRKKEELKKFLEIAGNIVDTVVQQGR